MPKQKLRIVPGGDRYHRWSACANWNWRGNMPMDPSHLSDDFRDFLICLNEACVDYLLVGGHAVAYHGYVRPTRDMDVWVAVSPQNAERLVAAVRKFFGGPLEGLAPEWFLDRESVTRFGAVPNQVEILPSISGGDFAAASARSVAATIDGQPVKVISLEDLIANKKASGRLKDLADVEQLTKP
ncbi:MAG TPA: hypothetical protein VFZ59_26525 [Verrucomicrobiae bacterium]|nr:hypothetical protein [Verrucomicrobiae bacterium]